MTSRYQLLGLLGRTADSDLYRARRLEDGSPVMLRLLACDHTGMTEAFKREYALLRSLDIAGMIKPEELILHEQGRLAMVAADFSGELLESVLGIGMMAWQACLKIASRLAAVLADVHAAHVIHQDIRPANILVAQENCEVLLADFSRAASRNQAWLSEGIAARPGDWAYLSPEQTGRMNRAVDYRTDFYSFGVTLYRMLTGRLPFAADDPLEWAHCHMARIPPAPCDLVPDVPRTVSDIVMKLLAKLPEDRYQSMRGLQADLERCLAQWQSSGRVAPFTPGMEDVSDRFQIPHKLYGREQERTALLAAFDRMAESGTRSVVTVSGYSGIGKSSLVGELHRPIVERRGYFISGKFDQYRRDIPYSTLAQAFREMVQQLLAQSEAHIAAWRQQIMEAVGANGQLIVDVLPQVELIIGKQPAVPALPPDQAEQHFRDVLRRFIGVFARQAHPLVLFLDDLQWIDPASLKLVEHLFTHGDICHLLLIAAYRDNEVSPTHPLQAALDAIRHSDALMYDIKLAPLPMTQLNRLAADTLHAREAACEPLTRLVFERTGGNPFFFTQFLDSLHKEGLLQWHVRDRAWRWDLDKIKTKNFADNVVALMVGKLRLLPAQVQEMLQLAACVGNKFDPRSLALVNGISEMEVWQRLATAVREDLIVPIDGIYKFLHDRIQQAAYSLIPRESLGGIHLRIGRALMAGMSAQELAEHVFDVTNQLNLGAALLADREEKVRVAELNLYAGRKAKASAAYVSACHYLGAGMALLDDSDWESRYRLAFDLWLERANCEYLLSHFDTVKQLIDAILAKSRLKTDQAAACHLKVLVHETLAEHPQAIDAALACLRLFGIDAPAHPSDEQVRQEYEAVWRNLDGRPIESLIDLPRLTDPEIQAVLEIFPVVQPSAFFTDIKLSQLLLGRNVNLSMQHGMSGPSTHGLAWFGALLGPAFRRYREGYEFAKLACAVVEKHGFTAYKAKAHYAANLAALWAQPVSISLDYAWTAYRSAVEAGDLSIACYSRTPIVANMLLRGDPLEAVWRESEQGLDFQRKARFRDVSDVLVAHQRFIADMQGRTTSFSSFDDAQFDEAAFEAQLTEDRMSTMICCYWIFKLAARFLSGDHAAAHASARKAKAILWAVSGHTWELDYYYYAALTAAALHEQAAPDEQREWHELLAAHQAQLREWAENYPPTFHDKYALVSAEIARLAGRDLEAMRLYEEAIQSAHDNGFVQNEGIAHELTARFHLARGFATAGNAHLAQARRCYARWGADGKVAQLEDRYPQLRADRQHATAMRPDGETPLDLLSVTKALQAISGRIVRDELIDTLMRLVIENAGAQTGYLLLARDGVLALAADAHIEAETVRVRLHGEQAPSAMRLPAAILNYVQRSHEHVLLMNAADPHPFSTDPYFAQRHPKSVLCLPILRQSTLTGLLYLENNLATHAFIADRVKVLELLACQAAISLENTRLYSDLQEREMRIRRLVDSNIIGIFFWDLAGNITDANDAFLALCGFSRADLQCGRINWQAMTTAQGHAADQRAMEELQQSGTCTPYEKEFVLKDGRRIRVLVGGAFLEGSSYHGLAFVLDLSERQRAEAEREARHAAEAANRAKSLFLANMSHELRTPLNGILGYTQILRRDKSLNERQRAGIDVIEQSGEHLLMMINDILDIAKIEAGKFELAVVDTELPDFLHAICDMVRVRAEQKGLTFACDISPELPRVVRADGRRLRQALLNLLANAVKFTDRGAVSLKVECAPPPRIRFEVRDTGIGIDPDKFGTIFLPFEQAGDVRRRIGGTGLGLAISNQFVRRMGGEIHVDSRPGHGSTFRFELDLPPVKTPAAIGQAKREITGYAGPRRTVLIVDDDAANRTLLTDALQPLGFTLCEAENGLQALELAQSRRPDLILMDVAMPRMDGLEATCRLRQTPGLEAIPVIVVSASASGSDAAASIAAGANAFLPKPLNIGRLLMLIAGLLKAEWTYESAAARAEAPDEMVAPPPEEMEVLLRLALMGNMREIRREAGRIARLDARYRSFARHLTALAEGYQSKAVQSFVERHLHAREGTKEQPR